MTFLEVVAAMAMLGMVAASLVGVVSFVSGSALREQQQLACAEVANRLLLQYLDEPTKMPDNSKTVEYGPPERPAKFRWEYTEQPVRFQEANPEARDQTRTQPLSPDRFNQVTVRVWLSEDSGGSRVPEVSTPMATLTRILDPVMPRNPDSYMNMLQDPQGFQRLMEQMMGFQGGVTVRGNIAQTTGQAQGQGGGQGGGRNRQIGQGMMGAGQAFRQGTRGNQGRGFGTPGQGNLQGGPRTPGGQGGGGGGGGPR